MSTRLESIAQFRCYLVPVSRRAGAGAHLVVCFQDECVSRPPAGFNRRAALNVMPSRNQNKLFSLRHKGSLSGKKRILNSVPDTTVNSYLHAPLEMRRCCFVIRCVTAPTAHVLPLGTLERQKSHVDVTRHAPRHSLTTPPYNTLPYRRIPFLVKGTPVCM